MNLLARINRWLILVSASALAIIVLLTSIDVVSANVRGRPLTGTYELVEVALIFSVFAGIPEIFRTEGNITVDVIDHFVSARAVAFLRGVAAIVGVVFLGLMGWSMSGPAIDAYNFGDMKADTGFPLWVMWVPVLAGTVLAIGATFAVLKRISSSRPPVQR